MPLSFDFLCHKTLILLILIKIVKAEKDIAAIDDFNIDY